MSVRQYAALLAVIICSFVTFIPVNQAIANVAAQKTVMHAKTDASVTFAPDILISDTSAKVALRKPAKSVARADEIVVYKSKRVMYLLNKGRIIRKYPVALGKNPVGHKLEWGDNRTPEGKYKIDLKNEKSAYHLSLRISYPDATDADVAASLDVNPGDWIMIHGLPNGRSADNVQHLKKDWTNGCIAVTNEQIREIWRMVDIGTPISIWP